MGLLIMENHEKTADALASGLERGGFSTTTAHTGEEGLYLLNAGASEPTSQQPKPKP